MPKITSTHPTPTAAEKENLLKLYQAAVKAKMQYWDAINAFEDAVGKGQDLTDKSVDALHFDIEGLAAGLNDPQSVDKHIDMKCLEKLLPEIHLVSD